MPEAAPLTSSLEVLKSTIDRRLVRFILRKLSGRCSKDEKSRLEVALELYTGVRDKACWTCTHIVAPIVRWAVSRGGKAFGVSDEQLKERFKDVYWRRGLVNVIRGIAKFGVRKPFTPGAPFLVVWNYTQMCNLRCKHCYASAGKPHPNELNTEEAKNVVKELADTGVTIIAFSGGEPLIRKDFFEVAQLAHDYGIFTAVATNGTLITEEVAKKLKDIGIGYVQISLDGATPETHDSFRGLKGVYEKVIRAIKNCVKQEVFVEVATTATKLTYKEIPEVIELCERLGVNWWMMYNFVPTGRGRFIIENDLSPEEREELLRFLWERLRSGKRMQVLSTAPQFARVALQMEKVYGKGDEEIIVPTHFYNPHLRGQLVNLSEFIGGCGAGRFYCAIDPDGTITPCVFFPLPVGNIKVDDFEELWETCEVFEHLRNRDLLKGNCGRCEYRYVCGGCRARAYGYFRDYLAPDPGCINNRDLWEKLKLADVASH
ncbi:MAG: radical SAM protein [Candidatus Baldrarchaeia archaeon]